MGTNMRKKKGKEAILRREFPWREGVEKRNQMGLVRKDMNQTRSKALHIRLFRKRRKGQLVCEFSLILSGCVAYLASMTLSVLGLMQLTLQSVFPWSLQMAMEKRP